MTVDPKEWLCSRGIPYRGAQKLAHQLKQHYPGLVKALKAHEDIIGELELVELVYHVQSGRFPPTRDILSCSKGDSDVSSPRPT